MRAKQDPLGTVRVGTAQLSGLRTPARAPPRRHPRRGRASGSCRGGGGAGTSSANRSSTQPEAVLAFGSSVLSRLFITTDFGRRRDGRDDPRVASDAGAHVFTGGWRGDQPDRDVCMCQAPWAVLDRHPEDSRPGAQSASRALKRGKCYGMPSCQGSHQPSAASDPPRGAPDFREEGAQGDDIERGTQRAGFGSLAVGELPIPLATIVYNTDLGLIEYHVEFAQTREARARRRADDHPRRRSQAVPWRLANGPVHRPQPLARADPCRLRADSRRLAAAAPAAERSISNGSIPRLASAQQALIVRSGRHCRPGRGFGQSSPALRCPRRW